MRAIDLFCGCGGLTLGLKEAGFQVIAGVDCDPLAVAAYRQNHPDTHVWEADIRRLTVKSVRKRLGLERGHLDLLAGCPPCQGFSTLRTRLQRASVPDPRNDLVMEFLRFVRVLRPKSVMLENVPGLAKDERAARFRSTLEDLGYVVGVRILNAGGFGVPQRRRRMILLAAKGREVPFPEPDEEIVTVRDALGGLPEPGESGDPLHDRTTRRSERIRQLIAAIPKNGGSRADLPPELELDCHKGFSGFKDVYGRMQWDHWAPTITGGCYNPSKGRFLHPEQDRAITLREAAILQGFPPGYHFGDGTKMETAQMIGNALPPPWMKALGSSVLTTLKELDV